MGKKSILKTWLGINFGLPTNTFIFLLITTVPSKGVVCCLGPEGNGVCLGEGGKGGPGLPDKGRDKQSNPSKEGGNMEQEEEGKKSQAGQRGPSVHRVSIVKKPLSMYLNVIKLLTT
jgi:hypothetical protein